MVARQMQTSDSAQEELESGQTARRVKRLWLLRGLVGTAGLVGAMALDRPKPAQAIGLSVQGASSLLWFDTFAELRNVSGGTTTSSTNVAVGRGTGETKATFVWDSADLTTPDDGLNVIVPLASPRTGCWKRLHNFEFNVKLFGAKGDGTSDDSVAIRNALLALPPNGGAIYFPPGTYLVSKDGINAWCLNLPDKVMLRGSGHGATTLKLAPGQDNWARILSATSRSGITIRDLTIDGNRLGQSSAWEQQHGIFLNACSGTVIQNVALRDTKGDCIYLFGNCIATVISGCQFSGGDRVHVHAHAFTNLAITGCHFSNSRANNHIKQEPDTGLISTGASVTGCTFDGDANSNGVLFAGHDPDTITTDITVSGNVFRNLRWGVCIGPYTQGWSVVGNTIENCRLGIQNVTYSESFGYTGNSHMQISGNLIRNLNVSDPDHSDQFPIFLSNCTVGSIHGNTVYAPQAFQGIRIANCSKVSINGNTISIGAQDSQGYAKGLVIYRCNNCAATANLIDLPVAQTPVGIWVSDTVPYVSANIVVQNNLVLGVANPAIKVDDASQLANVAVLGNLSPSAIAHLSGPAPSGQSDVTVFTSGVLAAQRVKMTPPLALPALVSADPPPSTHDWNPAGIHSHSYAVMRTSSPNATDGAQLTGITPGYDGDFLHLVNYGPGSITFAHDDAGSMPANRFYLWGESPYTIPRYGFISFRYDRSTGQPQRWVQVG